MRATAEFVEGQQLAEALRAQHVAAAFGWQFPKLRFVDAGGTVTVYVPGDPGSV
jgi:hypothetical protein